MLPGLIDLAEEPLPEETPFAVKLQRLERLGVVEVEVWRKLRELHNQIAHEYTDQPAIKAAAINRFLEGVEILIDALRQTESLRGSDPTPSRGLPSQVQKTMHNVAPSNSEPSRQRKNGQSKSITTRHNTFTFTRTSLGD